MPHYRGDVCVDGEASETDDEDHDRTPKMTQSSYREDNWVDGEASETDEEEERGGGTRPSVSSPKSNHLDVSGIKIIEKIEDAPPEHPAISTKWRAMFMAADSERVKIRRKHLVEARKLEKQVDTRFSVLQHSGRAIRPATDALLNVEALFENLAKTCDEIIKNRSQKTDHFNEK